MIPLPLNPLKNGVEWRWYERGNEKIDAKYLGEVEVINDGGNFKINFSNNYKQNNIFIK